MRDSDQFALLYLMQIGKICAEMQELTSMFSESISLISEAVDKAMQNADKAEITEEDRVGVLAILPTGEAMAFSIYINFDVYLPSEEIIERLGKTDFLFSYAKEDVLEINGKRYLENAILIYKTDPEGKILPMSEGEVILAKVEGKKMIRKLRVGGEETYVFALGKEGA
ncbi:MAG: hypothetical protein SOI56_06025 [Eubacteriales bacterium]